MGSPIQEFVLKSFKTVGVLSDSTDSGQASLAQNIRGRPVGAISSGPIYQRLCGIGNAAFVDAQYFALTYTPFGGSPRALVRASDKTIAIEVACNGEHLLLFYSLNTRRARGLFYMGNDGTFMGTPDFVNGSATMTVLAVGLDDIARWHGVEYYQTLALGNGVDPNAIVQLARTTQAPGKWRLAGSNQSPAAPVIRTLTPVLAPQIQATWTIPGTNRVTFDANIFVTVTANVATDTFTKASTTDSPSLTHGLLVGDPVWINPGGLGGVSAATVYYVIAGGLTLNNFKVSATLGGSAVNLTGAGTNIGVQSIGKVYAFGHAFKAGDTVTLVSEIQLPDFLPTGGVINTTTTYYVVNPTTNQIGLSSTALGSAIEINTPGVGVNQIVATLVSGNRMGPANLTFTADARNFPGTLGNNIYVSITYGSGPSPGLTALASTRSGSGTVSDPYLYSLFTGPGFSSTDAIIAFVNDDTNAVGVIAASGSTPDVFEDTQSWAYHELTGGQDSTTINGVAAGFSDKTCSVYLRYWDVGVNQVGYEGISSPKSNVIIIDALSSFAIEVAVAPNPSVESSRFGFIRVYFQQGEDANALWTLMAEVPNVKPAFNVTCESAFNCTVIASADTISQRMFGAPVVNNGDVVRFTASGTLPAPLSATVNYYAVSSNSSTFKVSLTKGSAPVNITTAGSGVSNRRIQILQASGNTFAVGDVIQFTTTGALPDQLALNTDYYVVNPVTLRFEVSTSITGQPIDVMHTSSGSGTSTATLRVKKVLLGAETPIGQIMQVDQNRPLPSTLSVISGGNVWHGGVPSNPTYLYPSKQANWTEVFPEGANALAFQVMRFPASTSSQAITALYSDEQNLHVHSAGGIVYFPPSNPAAQTFPRVFAGAVTESALAVWTKNRLNYLGGDLQIYEQTQSVINPLQSDFVALDAAAFIKANTDRNAFNSSPDRCFMFSDIAGQALWLWLPGLSGGLVGFCYDRVQKGVMGPYTVPMVHSMVKMEAGVPVYIFVDEAGNLMCWDTSAQFDYDRALPTSSTPTVHTLGSGATTPSEQGFSQTPVTGGELWRSSTSSLETGFIDLSKPGQLKAFLGAVISTVKNSRALLTFTFSDKAGNSQTVNYGDIYVTGVNNTNKVLCNIQSSAVKVRMDFITSEMNPFAVRDLTVLWRSQKQA